ncbi:CDP-glycerol glycerophosphotransferase family protein [Secundilactobacillus oryzae]
MQKLINFIKIIIRGGLIVLNDGFICLPVKKGTVIFESFNGKDISDNPAAIYRALASRPEVKATQLYFGVKPRVFAKVHQEFPEVQLLKRFSLKWIWVIARAEFWVFNSRMPLWWHKNRGTTYIQTWHGTPLKKLGIDIEDVNIPGTTTAKYKQQFAAEAGRWQYLIAPNQYSKEIFARAFAFQGQFLEVGYPRNDYLYHTSSNEVSQIKKRLIGNTTTKVIVYAPTWRDDQAIKTGQYQFELPFNLKAFFETVSSDYHLIIRPHYLVKDLIDITGFEDRVSIEADIDISELYLIADLLITDYSSVMFDFANLKKPMLFYAYDLAHYRDQLRGFYFDYQTEIPGPLVTEQSAFYESLRQFAEQGRFPEYEQKYAAFYDKFCSFENGEASEKLADLILGRNQNESVINRITR